MIDTQLIVRHRLESNHPQKTDYPKKNKDQNDRYGKASPNHRTTAQKRGR
jgi:hypothetical protein